MFAPLLFLVQADPSPHSGLTVTASVRQAAPEIPFEVVAHITLDDGWHTYWRNPGDTGSPTTFSWDLPKGWKVSLPRFVAPEKIVAGGLVSYGYERSADVMFTVTPPAGAKSATLKGEGMWLVCQEACVPATESIRLSIPVGAQAEINPDYQRPELPTPLPGATAMATSTGYRLKLPLRSTDGSAYFFPSNAATLDHAADQKISVGTDGITLDLAKSSYTTGTVKRLRGVLVLSEGPTYTVSVPVKGAPLVTGDST